MKSIKLFDAEERFMNIIWELEPVGSTELVYRCLAEFDWKKSTTYTMLKRLVERGIVENNNAIVSAIVKRSEVQRYESEAVLSKSFGGSLPTFLTAFLSDKKLSKKEAEEIIEILKGASGSR